MDAAGLVYEGRWSGTDGDPAHNAAGQLVTAAHIATYNSGNVGIALLGTFTTGAPTSAARGALVQPLAELATRHSIDPLQQKVGYVNPVNGATWSGQPPSPATATGRPPPAPAAYRTPNHRRSARTWRP